MLKDITIGQYLVGNSFLHKLDPRTKIIGVLLYMIALFTVNNFIGMGAMIVVSAFFVLLSQIPLNYFLKGLNLLF